MIRGETKNSLSAIAFLEQLSEHELQLAAGEGDYEKICNLIKPIDELESPRKIEEYRELILPKLVPFLFLLIDTAKKMAKQDPDFNDQNVDMALMIRFVKFQYPKGLEAVAELMKLDHKNDDFCWYTILSVLIEDKETAKIIVDKLGDQLPNGCIGICYLDMLNGLNLKDISFDPHPFSSPQGIARLEQYLTTDYSQDPYNGKYGRAPDCAVVALVFLPEHVWKKLLPIALTHPNKTVQIEAQWAGTKLKDKDSREKLIEEAKDYRYGQMCVRYLRELGLEDLIPEECQTEEFTASAAISSWLSSPFEFGAVPTELSIVDSRTLYWTPTKDKRQLTIVRYRYEKWNKDGTDEIGIGLVGSVTFCLFGLEGLNERTPEEIYAIHCGWEMNLDDYENPDVGMRLLKKHNPGFGKS